MEPQHLGDGVYATGAGSGELILTTGHHNPADAHNVIFLESEVLQNLKEYIERMQGER